MYQLLRKHSLKTCLTVWLVRYAWKVIWTAFVMVKIESEVFESKHSLSEICWNTLCCAPDQMEREDSTFSCILKVSFPHSCKNTMQPVNRITINQNFIMNCDKIFLKEPSSFLRSLVTDLLTQCPLLPDQDPRWWWWWWWFIYNRSCLSVTKVIISATVAGEIYI